jgi:hypothetical protein
MHKQALPRADALRYFDSKGNQYSNDLIYGKSTSARAKLV